MMIDYCSMITMYCNAGISWEGSSVYKRYIVSLYWTVTTITSVGYIAFFMI